MDDFHKLFYFTPMESEPLDEVSDKQIEIIHSFLIDADLLALRVAQLKFNNRVRNEDKIWWDDLKVYLGIPKTNIKDVSILEVVTSVPFGLLYELFSLSGSNQNFTIKYNWDNLEQDGLYHTDVDEFSTYSLAQEWHIQNDGDFLEQLAGEEWATLQPELENQIVHSPNAHVIKKATFVILELLYIKDNCRRFERLISFVEIFSLLRNGDLCFSKIEDYLVYEREIAESVGGFIHENKPFDEFDLEDFFNFGFQIIELSYYYNHDFAVFLEFIEDIIASNDEEKWSSDTLELFKELHAKYLDNNEV